MNEVPETDDDLSIRHLLAESGAADSPELLEGLRRLRSFRAVPAPEPSGELAALLADRSAPPRRRSQRHRGLILSFALAGAMAAGTTGVAANNDLRLATDSFCADLIEQVLPAQDAGEEPQPPAEPADDVLAAAGDAVTDAGTANPAPVSPNTVLSNTPLPVAPTPVTGAADAGGSGEEAPTPQPPSAVLPAPEDESEPAVLPGTVRPESAASPEDRGGKPGRTGGERPPGVHPGPGRTGDGAGRSDFGRPGAGDVGPGHGNSRNASPNSAPDGGPGYGGPGHGGPGHGPGNDGTGHSRDGKSRDGGHRDGQDGGQGGGR